MRRSLVLAPLVLAFGCAHKPATPPPQDPSKVGMASNSDSKGRVDTGKDGMNTLDTDAACRSARVHFPFNSADLPDEEKKALESWAACLRREKGLHLTIEGSADERGTEEYNLSLGERRARVVESYLERLGASKAQLKTVSYGKENPICTQHDESCWAQNRRAELQPAR